MKNKVGMDMEKLLQNWRQAEVRELSISLGAHTFYQNYGFEKSCYGFD